MNRKLKQERWFNPFRTDIQTVIYKKELGVISITNNYVEGCYMSFPYNYKGNIKQDFATFVKNISFRKKFKRKRMVKF